MVKLFKDGPEYLQRKNRPYVYPKTTLKALQAVIPKELHERSTFWTLAYVARDLSFATFFAVLASYTETIVNTELISSQGPYAVWAVRSALWLNYWFFQGVIFMGFWVMAHEAGHGSLSPSAAFNHVLGFVMHTFLLVPYYSWRHSHHLHHKATGSMEKDENYVPRTRSQLKLPNAREELLEALEESPIATFFRCIAMQLLGWHSYMSYNALGNTSYPPGTNHYNPWSPLFTEKERKSIIISDIGLAVMMGILGYFIHKTSWTAFLAYYVVPWIGANHWVVMLTFLHHTDSTIPHFRNGWDFLKGATATVDRPLLGPLGRIMLHNISHDHVAHHLFSRVPFWNMPKVTELIKPVLGESYNYDSTNTFYAYWRSWNECKFIDDEGDIIFYLGKDGSAQRQAAPGEAEKAVKEQKQKEIGQGKGLRQRI